MERESEGKLVTQIDSPGRMAVELMCVCVCLDTVACLQNISVETFAGPPEPKHTWKIAIKYLCSVCVWLECRIHCVHYSGFHRCSLAGVLCKPTLGQHKPSSLCYHYRHDRISVGDGL